MFDAIRLPVHRAPFEAVPFPIRRMGRPDAAALATFAAGLDGLALRARFDGFTTAAILHAHYERIDWSSGTVLAWVADGAIRGVVESFFYDTERGLEAEVALCVGEGWRGRGIGGRLVARALTEGAERGAWRSVMELGARGCGLARIVRAQGGTVEASSGLAVVVHGEAAVIVEG